MDSPDKLFENMLQKQIEMQKKLQEYQLWKDPKVLEQINRLNASLNEIDKLIKVEMKREMEYQQFLKEKQQQSIKSNIKADDTFYSFDVERLNQPQGQYQKRESYQTQPNSYDDQYSQSRNDSRQIVNPNFQENKSNTNFLSSQSIQKIQSAQNLAEYASRSSIRIQENQQNYSQNQQQQIYNQERFINNDPQQQNLSKQYQSQQESIQNRSFNQRPSFQSGYDEQLEELAKQNSYEANQDQYPVLEQAQFQQQQQNQTTPSSFQQKQSKKSTLQQFDQQNSQFQDQQKKVSQFQEQKESSYSGKVSSLQREDESRYCKASQFQGQRENESKYQNSQNIPQQFQGQRGTESQYQDFQKNQQFYEQKVYESKFQEQNKDSQFQEHRGNENQQQQMYQASQRLNSQNSQGQQAQQQIESKQQFQQKKNSIQNNSEFQELTSQQNENSKFKQSENPQSSNGSPTKKKSMFEQQQEAQKYFQEQMIAKQSQQLDQSQQQQNKIMQAQYNKKQIEDSKKQYNTEYSEVIYEEQVPISGLNKIKIQEIPSVVPTMLQQRQPSIKSNKPSYHYTVDQKTFQQMEVHRKNLDFRIIQDKVFEDDGNEGICSICLSVFFGASNKQESYVVQLHCSHKFHYNCLKPVLGEHFVKCPNCNKIQGEQIGDQPNGTMEHAVVRKKCAGYNCDTIQITYDFPNGKRNNIHYTGTTRTAYLPNNQEGQRVLLLLKKAFHQKLIFTVGRSVTTGRDNCVVWAGIHHKTSLDGGPTNFGYPDPTYFERVTSELKDKGIV